CTGRGLPRHQRLYGARVENRSFREEGCGAAVRVPGSGRSESAVPGSESGVRDHRLSQYVSGPRQQRRPAQLHERPGQRPGRALGSGQAFCTLTVGNGVVFIGYQDGKGTMVALDAESGRKLFEFHNQIKLADGSAMRSGAVEGGPQVVDNMVYWGVGAESGGLFTNRDGVNINAGSRVFGFELTQDREESSEDREERSE